MTSLQYLVLSNGRKYIPTSLQNFLKPYYRLLFPSIIHIAITPTFRCNYRCPYCHFVTKAEYYKKYPKDAELPAEKWIKALDGYPRSLISICGGGEPFLYDDIFELINGLTKKHTITNIVTNLSLKIDEIVENIDPSTRFSVSYHAYMVDLQTFTQNILTLKENGFNHINVTFVGYPEKLDQIPKLSQHFQNLGVNFSVDPYLEPTYQYSREQLKVISEYSQMSIREKGYNHSDTKEKKCLGGRNWFGIFPKGDIYSCFAGFYYFNGYYNNLGQNVSKYYMGNILEDFQFKDANFICSLPCCEACDLELASPREYIKDGLFK